MSADSWVEGGFDVHLLDGLELDYSAELKLSIKCSKENIILAIAASTTTLLSPFDPDENARISLNGSAVERINNEFKMLDALIEEAEKIKSEDYLIELFFSNTEEGRGAHRGRRKTVLFTSDASKEDFENLDKEVWRQREEKKRQADKNDVFL